MAIAPQPASGAPRSLAFYAFTVPATSLVAAALTLILARLLWSPAAFGLLATPLFFVAMLLGLACLFAWALFAYLLLRHPR